MQLKIFVYGFVFALATCLCMPSKINAANDLRRQAYSATDVQLLVIFDGEKNDIVAEFDLAALDNLPQTKFMTTTIWTEGPIEFSGPSLRSILESVGTNYDSVTAVALNDYSMDISIEGVGSKYPIVATRMNGDTFSIRQRGPLWIVYPYDQRNEFKTEIIYSKSVWQLYKLIINR